MEKLDYLYRAYQAYRGELTEDRVTQLFKKGANTQINKQDYISITKVECIVDEEWIKVIEKGLVYVAKAIGEDRQFIRNTGDVFPIEKIRKVSQDSIVDLAKHSNYITRLPEDEADLLVPDKLLMIQRENDYHIYENRVVYATLSYLRDFIAIRLNAISDISNRYEGKVFVERRIDLGYRSIDLKMEMDEIQKEDPYEISNNQHLSVIARLNQILNETMMLLRTRLMSDVSKAPLVSKPITKTNVLRMNINFRESLALFDYISGYNEDGYTIQTVPKFIKPLKSDQNEAFVDIMLMTSFIAYQSNHLLENKLQERFLLENKRRQDIANEEIVTRLNEAMNKAKKSDLEINQYLVLLEDGVKVYEARVEEGKQEHLRQTEEHKKELELLQNRHDELIDELTSKYESIILEMNQSQQENMAVIEEEHRSEVNALKEQENIKSNELIAQHVKEIEELTNKNNEMIETLKKDNAQHQTTIESMVKEKEIAENSERMIKEQMDLLKAEMLVLKIESNDAPSAKKMTSRERFLELERQKKVLDKYFEEAWKETKKEIRTKHLTITKKEKGN